MTAEWAAIWITFVGLVGTVLNVWLTMRIRNDILGLKVWSMEKFIAKADIASYIPPYQRMAVQVRESERRGSH